MFRELRRKKQLLPENLTREILAQGVTGVLGVSGDDGYPYAVPLNYAYAENTIYFHCAKAGHKLDAIRRNDKVSFCVIDKEDIVPEAFTTYFRSVIAFGRAAEVTEDDEKLRAIRLLNRKYAPGLEEKGENEIKKEWNILSIVRIGIEHMTGKQAIELMNKPGPVA